MTRWFVLLAVLLLNVSIASAQSAPVKGLTLRLIEQGLNKPVDFCVDPAGRQFVAEQPGRIVLLQDGKKVKTPYLDITDRVFEQGECGFLGIAFHPKFADNGRLFVNYTKRDGPKGKINTIISEFKADPKATSVDASTEKVILTIGQPQANHNGGQIKFGPDGMLYIGMGDGGSGGDRGAGHFEPGGNGQYRRTMLGKILRIDVNGEPGTYAVPKDNPFVGNDEWLPEIWATGLRNPWRFTFDRKTGLCYTGDVGQNKLEEIHILTAGGNYGWRIMEGSQPFRPDEKSPDKLIPPIAEYGRNFGQSVTGGFVYRGKHFPQLQGVYLYADFATGRFWGLTYENEKVTWNAELPVTVNDRTGPNLVSPASFGEDADGELYVCDHRGRLYQVTVSK